MKKTKILNIVVGVIMLIAIVFWIRTGMAGDDLKGNAAVQASVLNPYMYLTYILLAVAALLAIGSSIMNLIHHPQQLKRSLMGVGFMLVVLLAAYLVAQGGAVTNMSGKEIADASVSKWVSTGIWYSIFLAIIGFAFFLVDFVKSLVK